MSISSAVMKPPFLSEVSGRPGPFSFPRTSSVGNVFPLLGVNDQNHSHEHPRSRPPRWRRVHHSWIFWVAVFLMLLAIVTYVMTGDLFWALHRQ